MFLFNADCEQGTKDFLLLEKSFLALQKEMLIFMVMTRTLLDLTAPIQLCGLEAFQIISMPLTLFRAHLVLSQFPNFKVVPLIHGAVT